MQPDVTAALVYVLASWACAAFVTIWAYLAISVSRLGPGHVLPSTQPVPVSAIRILFHSADPSRRGTTVKVAIQGFTFFGR
jgi:hypothetical protein